MPSFVYDTPNVGVVLPAPDLRVMMSPVQVQQGRPPTWAEPVEMPCLTPQRLTWRMNGKPSTLTLRWNLAAEAWQRAGRADRVNPHLPPESLRVQPGDRITLARLIGGEWRELFDGCIGQDGLLIQAHPDAESREITAYGPELLLANREVRGQWHMMAFADDKAIAGELTSEDAVAGNTFRSDLPVVFHRDRRPNASASAWLLDQAGAAPRAGRVFRSASDGSSLTTHWTAYSALVSLLAAHGGGDLLDLAALAAYETMLDVAIGQVMVEGMDLLEAVAAVLKPVGFGFAVTPYRQEKAMDSSQEGRTAKLHELQIFPLAGRGGADGPMLGGAGGAAVSMASNEGLAFRVQRVELLRDAHNVRNHVTVVGDMKRRQVALEFNGAFTADRLLPAWDLAAHDLADYAADGVLRDINDDAWLNRYCRSGRDNVAYFNVFRTFALNDDGWLSRFSIPGGGTYPTASLPGCGAGEDVVRRPRPMGRTLIPNQSENGALPAYVEAGIIGDEDAWILLPHAAVLRDHCGFTLHVDRLDTFYPWRDYASSGEAQAAYADQTLATLLYNTLNDGDGHKVRFRLVGSVECDEAVKATVGRSVESAWPFDAERTVYAKDRFACALADYQPTGTGLIARDDAKETLEYARSVQKTAGEAMQHASIVMRGLTLAYRPGMAIRQTGGRAVPLGTADGAGAEPIIREVSLNFAASACKTELVLDSELLGVHT